MSRILSRLLVLSVPLALLAGCEQVKSANPLSPLVAGPIAGVSIDSPSPVAPTAAAQIPFPQQPITLTINNASTNGVRPVSYVFEIGFDSGFVNKAFTQTGVPAGQDGHTSFKMPESLQAERTYFWRAMADDGANSSGYSETISFRIFTPVVIQAPALREPGEGATVTTRRPTLVVTNATRTGPAGNIEYLFEVATDASMGSRVVSQVVGEGSGQTSFTVPDDLAATTRYFWRAKALDSKNQSDYSGIRSFLTPAVPVTAPNNPLPITPIGGAPAAADHINLSQAVMLNSPNDFASWPITTAITGLNMRPSGISVDFSKKDGPGRWPEVTPPGWSGSLQYTLGMCLSINGKWYCSAVVEYWYGLGESGGEPWNYATNWFYDSSRWAPMTGHQPSPGEMIGMFVCAGDCRNNTKGDLSPARERTNVVLVPMPGSGGANYKF